MAAIPGVKPQAESSSPFGTKFHGPFDTGSSSPDERAHSYRFMNCDARLNASVKSAPPFCPPKKLLRTGFCA